MTRLAINIEESRIGVGPVVSLNDLTQVGQASAEGLVESLTDIVKRCPEFEEGEHFLVQASGCWLTVEGMHELEALLPLLDDAPVLRALQAEVCRRLLAGPLAD